MTRSVRDHVARARRRRLPIRTVLWGALVVGVGAVPAAAALLPGSVGCGLTACSDTWTVSCPSSTFMTARVRVTIGGDDTLMVTLVANGPSSIRGQAESEVADSPGSVSPLSVLLASKDTSITAFAVVTNLFNTGDSAYEIEFTCGKGNGGAVQPKDVKLLQDQ